jgi:hypothetical protein
MISKLTNTRAELAPAGILNIDAPAGLVVACESGLVWVTVEGERTDHWLVAGDAFAVRRSGRVVIEAAQASRVTLQEPEKLVWQWRWPTRRPRAAQHFAA